MARNGSGDRTLHLIYRLGPSQAEAARRALARGADVACVSADPGIAERFGDAVAELPPGALPAFEEAVQVHGSFDLAEIGVRELRRRRPGLARALARLAADDDVYRYLCRSLLREVGGLFALTQLVASPHLDGYARVEVDRHWPSGAELAFLSGLARRQALKLPPPLAAALARTEFGASDGSAALRAKTALRALQEGAALWAGWLARLRRVEGELPKRALLVRTYETDWEVAAGGPRRLRRVDFVVDGDTILPSEVAIWAEDGVPAERDRELASRGYEVLRRGSVTVGPAGFATRVLPALVGATPLLLRLAAAEGWWRRPALRLVSETLLWREVVLRARPRALLVYNDVHPAGTARTLALRRLGCRTVAYEHSSSWAFDEHGWIPDFVNGFLVADAIVTWGPLHSETFAKHRGSIGDYWDVGCLWSEHARLVREDPELRARCRDELAPVLSRPLAEFEHVVGVFDTSSAPLLLGYDDLVAFYAGVAALAARLPRVLFLCKPKTPVETVFAAGAGGAEAEAALRRAPNVVVLDPHFETAVPVGLCDLSVDACYTSPALETIGAGRPAVHYDPTDRFPDAFFRRIPGFVATSEDELVAFVEQRLAAPPEARDDDLHERFSTLEGHFDGLAITRLRARLRTVMDG